MLTGSHPSKWGWVWASATGCKSKCQKGSLSHSLISFYSIIIIASLLGCGPAGPCMACACPLVECFCFLLHVLPPSPCPAQVTSSIAYLPVGGCHRVLWLLPGWRWEQQEDEPAGAAHQLFHLRASRWEDVTCTRHQLILARWQSGLRIRIRINLNCWIRIRIQNEVPDPGSGCVNCTKILKNFFIFVKMYFFNFFLMKRKLVFNRFSRWRYKGKRKKYYFKKLPKNLIHRRDLDPDLH